jgi:hypothetical protein
MKVEISPLRQRLIALGLLGLVGLVVVFWLVLPLWPWLLLHRRLLMHLLSLLLARDPAKRPSAARVLEHPFVTGRDAARLSGEPPAWDVFISYRVASDASLAQDLYEALKAAGLRVFYDKECLRLGKSWRDGFCAGLSSSRAFVPLLSRGGFNCVDAAGRPVLGRNWGALAADSPVDNVLLEHRLALGERSAARARRRWRAYGGPPAGRPHARIR